MNSIPTQTKNLTELIRVENLSWQADDNCILNDINFSVKTGSFTGLIGANGAGKSSLLRCLYRFIKPDTGCVSFQQNDIWHLSANDYAKQIAVVLQEAPAQFNLSVYDVVSLGLIPHQPFFSSSKILDNDKVNKAIHQVGLTDKTLQPFEHLSGGEKQRALIARAIVQSPQLLIMDEPTSHLDVKYQIQVMELARSLGITVIASFHDLNLASAMCDNIIVLKDGELVTQGTPSTVFNEQMLSDVFGVCAQVSVHPMQNVPQITYFYEDTTKNNNKKRRPDNE